MVGDANPGNRGQRIRYLFPKQQLSEYGAGSRRFFRRRAGHSSTAHALVLGEQGPEYREPGSRIRQCLLMALSGHGRRPLTMSDFRGRADIKRHGDESPLMTHFGHTVTVRSSGSRAARPRAYRRHPGPARARLDVTASNVSSAGTRWRHIACEFAGRHSGGRRLPLQRRPREISEAPQSPAAAVLKRL